MNEEQFRARYVVEGECWRWVGSLKDGYGRFHETARFLRVPRWSYEHFIGPTPEGRQVDHFLYPETCIGRACVNPAHLRPVSQRENLLRGDTIVSEARARRMCIHGHVFDEANTYWTRTGKRYCRKCRGERKARYRRLRREAS